MDRSVWTILLTLDLVLLGLLVISLPYVERGTPTYTITLLSFGIIAVTLAGLAVVIFLDWTPFEG